VSRHLAAATTATSEVDEMGSFRATVQEEVLAARELRPPTECAEAASVSGPGAPLLPLPPLALARELPEYIRGQLEPTPLDELVEQDRQLAAAVVCSAVPDGVFMLRMNQSSPWVQRVLDAGRDVVLLKAPAPPPQPRSRLPRNSKDTKGGWLLMLVAARPGRQGLVQPV
jgi:hypothetical protein